MDSHGMLPASWTSLLNWYPHKNTIADKMANMLIVYRGRLAFVIIVTTPQIQT